MVFSLPVFSLHLSMFSAPLDVFQEDVALIWNHHISQNHTLLFTTFIFIIMKTKILKKIILKS